MGGERGGSWVGISDAEKLPPTSRGAATTPLAHLGGTGGGVPARSGRWWVWMMPEPSAGSVLEADDRLLMPADEAEAAGA